MGVSPIYQNEGFHIDHWGNGISVIFVDLREPTARLPIQHLVKGCRSEHAIEAGADVKISTPEAFRHQGENLIRDSAEGQVSESRVLRDVRDDPDDLERAMQKSEALNRIAELTGSGWRQHTNSTHTTRLKSRSLAYAPHGWLFCASIEPDTPEGWREWWATLETSYDHVSHIYRPREFARALGSIFAEQVGAQSGTAQQRSTASDLPSHRSDFPYQAVFHGPVVYVADVRSWLEDARSEGEMLLRSMFVKAASHAAQQEYRFVIQSEEEPEQQIHLLRSSPALRGAITATVRSLGPPVVLELEPEECEAEQATAARPNPLDGMRMWHDLTDQFREQVEQSGGIYRPDRRDAEPGPSGMRDQVAFGAAVTMLHWGLRDFHERVGPAAEQRNAATAAAWFAVQDIRALCETFDDPIAGLEFSDDGCILIHVSLHEQPELRCRLAVAPTGHSSLTMEYSNRGGGSSALSPFFRGHVGEKVRQFLNGTLTTESDQGSIVPKGRWHGASAAQGSALE